MPRFQRVVVPGVAHHIVNRGNRRQDVFFSPEDYAYYLEMLCLFSRIYEVRIIAYCLMTNHVHIVAIPSDEMGLTQMMADVQKSYTRMINFKKKWRGHLWQGRYFSCPMDELYTQRTVRYVELNPIKAKLEEKIGQYPYSSARIHLGLEKSSLIETPYFDFDPKQWREFLEEGLNPDNVELDQNEIQNANGRPLGDQAFVERLEIETGRILQIQKSGPKNHSKVNA